MAHKFASYVPVTYTCVNVAYACSPLVPSRDYKAGWNYIVIRVCTRAHATWHCLAISARAVISDDSVAEVRAWANWPGPLRSRSITPDIREAAATICQLTYSDYSRSMVRQWFPAPLARDRLIHGLSRSLLPFAGNAFVPKEDPRGFRFSVDCPRDGFVRCTFEIGMNETEEKERKWSLSLVIQRLE